MFSLAVDMLTAHLSAGRACKGPTRRRITRPLPTASDWLLIEGTIYRIQEYCTSVAAIPLGDGTDGRWGAKSVRL